MKQQDISRKDLNNQEFMKLRQATEKISAYLGKRLLGHVDILKPLFTPRKLLGTYVKSSTMDEVQGADKAFAALQEAFASVCEKPFSLPKKLQAPLPPISTQIDAAPFEYSLAVKGDGGRDVSVMSPVRWIVSYRSECPLSRLRAMLSGKEPKQPDDMKHALLSHLLPIVYLKQMPALEQLLADLRYQIEIRELADLGNLPVLVLKNPVDTFLPPDDFILQVTQLSGIAAFQEIIDLDALAAIPDSLKEDLSSLAR